MTKKHRTRAATFPDNDMTSKPDTKPDPKPDEKPERKLKITIVNEDNGDDLKLNERPETPLSNIFEEMYKKLRVQRQNDDRLRCEEGDSDVFQFAHLTLGEYAAAGHCKGLVWLFAGGTGGAV